jgi:hypothetical protein
MVMQWTVNPPPSGTTGSIPVFSTRANDYAHSLTVVSDDERYRNFQIFWLVRIMVITSDCLSDHGSSILPRVASFCGKESKRRMGSERALNLISGYLTCHKIIIAEYGSGHPSGLISHEIVGSNPTSATSFESVSK